ncbi:hypothetical protein [Streptomyces sp. NPDC007205]|uniref:terpene synthase family protein n=1 Tax=Streptomyces sp. NPDC007205 TaxID=3154316 RepID=UPI00340A92D0
MREQRAMQAPVNKEDPLVTFAPGFELQPFFCPIEEAIHPDYEELARACVEWADANDMYGDDAVERAWGLFGTRSDLAFARGCPAAPKDRMFILMLWALWIFVGDDNHHHDTNSIGLTGRPGGPSNKIARMVDLAGRMTCATDGPETLLDKDRNGGSRLVRTLARIMDMIRARATPTQMQRILDRQRQWVLGELWLSSALELGIVPTVEEYTMQRHSSSGGLYAFEVQAWGQDLRMTDAERNHPTVVAAANAANMVISWDNDLISYPKEERHGEEKGNSVGVMAHQLCCSPQDAVAEVTAVRDRVMSLFLALHEKLTHTGSDDVRQFVDLLAHIIRGHLDWAVAIPRYREITDHKEPPTLDLPQMRMEWSHAPSDPCMEPVDIGPIKWWWDQLR